jgi:hypothetical protein
VSRHGHKQYMNLIFLAELGPYFKVGISKKRSPVQVAQALTRIYPHVSITFHTPIENSVHTVDSLKRCLKRMIADYTIRGTKSTGDLYWSRKYIPDRPTHDVAESASLYLRHCCTVVGKYKSY